MKEGAEDDAAGECGGQGSVAARLLEECGAGQAHLELTRQPNHLEGRILPLAWRETDLGGDFGNGLRTAWRGFGIWRFGLPRQGVS